MRIPGPLAFGLVMGVLAPGCRLPGHEGPISSSLASCRQYSQQGVAAIERGQWPQAEILLAKAVAACPTDAEARRHYAETLWLRGARKEAIEQLEAAVRLAGEDAVLWVRLTEMYLAVGRKDLAETSAEQALDLNPKLPAAWAMRAHVRQANGQARQALADYQRALGYAPEERQILLEVARLYQELNEPHAALATLQTLADTYGPSEEPQEVLYLEGLAFAALGRNEEAVEALSGAASRGQPSAEILYRLGEAELLAGKRSEAAAAAQQALTLEPQHGGSRKLLNRLDMAGQPETAPRR